MHATPLRKNCLINASGVIKSVSVASVMYGCASGTGSRCVSEMVSYACSVTIDAFKVYFRRFNQFICQNKI